MKFDQIFRPGMGPDELQCPLMARGDVYKAPAAAPQRPAHGRGPRGRAWEARSGPHSALIGLFGSYGQHAPQRPRTAPLR